MSASDAKASAFFRQRAFAMGYVLPFLVCKRPRPLRGRVQAFTKNGRALYGAAPSAPPSKEENEGRRRKKKCKTKAQQLRENEQLCFSVLNQYRRLLLDWEKRYAPQAPEDVLDERFVEACHRLPWAEYQLDILLQGDSYERSEVVSELTADGYIRKLQTRLREERYHE